MGKLTNLCLRIPTYRHRLLNGDSPEGILQTLAKDFLSWQKAWKEHPDCTNKFSNDPVVLMRFKHEDKGKGNFSGLISNLFGLLQPQFINWGEKKFNGIFSDIQPVESWMPVHPSRVIIWSCSPNNAYACRESLKNLLPKSKRKVVNHLRRVCNVPKFYYLMAAVEAGRVDLEDTHSRKNYPNWYKKGSQRLFVLNDKKNQNLFSQLESYASPEDLYDIVTGRVDFRSVPDLVRHQLSIFE